MNLAQIQSALFSLVTDDGKTPVQPDQIVGGGALAPVARVGIYAEMYYARATELEPSEPTH